MKILVIFPHPDDETIFCGGTIARHIKNGDEAVWICAGLGERSGNSAKRFSKLFYYSHLILGNLPFLIFMQKLAVWWLSFWRKPNAELAKIRKKEALEAAKILGISKIHFWEMEDMKFGKHIKKMADEIKKYVEIHKPEIIYTFHFNGLTGHPDHISLSRAVIKAVKESDSLSRPEIFGAATPREIVKKFKLPVISVAREKIVKEVILTSEELKIKKQALEKYRSQSYIWEVFLQKRLEVLEREYFAEL